MLTPRMTFPVAKTSASGEVDWRVCGMLLAHEAKQATGLGLRPTGAVLFVGLLLLGGAPLLRSAGGQAGAGSISAAASPYAEPLAAPSTTTGVSAQPLQPPPSSLAGINNTIWEDSSSGTCADCTYTVFLEPSLGSPNTYFLAIWYLTDPSCPPAVQTELLNLDISANGTMLNDNPGYTHMELCTRASNPIVQDCGQDQIWYVDNFTLTVTQTSISGEYQSQYWTWDTASNGAISNCSIEYNYAQPFALTPVFSSTSVSSSTTTSQQNNATANPPPVQTSGSSTTRSSALSSSSTTTTTHSGGSGYLGIEILLAVSVLVVVGAGSWAVLRRRPVKASLSQILDRPSR
jgi:hypothetical protein